MSRPMMTSVLPNSMATPWAISSPCRTGNIWSLPSACGPLSSSLASCSFLVSSAQATYSSAPHLSPWTSLSHSPESHLVPKILMTKKFNLFPSFPLKSGLGYPIVLQISLGCLSPRDIPDITMMLNKLLKLQHVPIWTLGLILPKQQACTGLRAFAQTVPPPAMLFPKILACLAPSLHSPQQRDFPWFKFWALVPDTYV